VSRAWAVLIGLALLATGTLLGLYGLFAILYRGDSGGSGDTYVSFGGHEIDADLAGAIALLFALIAILGATAFLKHPRGVSSNPPRRAP
jgi:hypothetical protein